MREKEERERAINNKAKHPNPTTNLHNGHSSNVSLMNIHRVHTDEMIQTSRGTVNLDGLIVTTSDDLVVVPSQYADSLIVCGDTVM